MIRPRLHFTSTAVGGLCFLGTAILNLWPSGARVTYFGFPLKMLARDNGGGLIKIAEGNFLASGWKVWDRTFILFPNAMFVNFVYCIVTTTLLIVLTEYAIRRKLGHLQPLIKDHTFKK